MFINVRGKIDLVTIVKTPMLNAGRFFVYRGGSDVVGFT